MSEQATAQAEAQTKSRGQIDYEASVTKRPNYPDGTPRKTWGQLDDIARWSWERKYEVKEQDTCGTRKVNNA